MTEIALDRLTKVYPDGTEAVRQLDLEIADGELVVFVGPSGRAIVREPAASRWGFGRRT